jgi:hypothetical protein
MDLGTQPLYYSLHCALAEAELEGLGLRTQPLYYFLYCVLAEADQEGLGLRNQPPHQWTGRG